MYWRYSFVKGKDYVKNNGGWAEARNKIVRDAINNKSRWLFFLDSDVLPDPSVLSKMFAKMSDKVKIITGIYYMKTYPPQPILFKHLGDGPYYNFPVEDFFEVEGCGCGCLLLDLEVFEEFDRKGIKYFEENWIDTKPNGSKVHVKIGEDHWLAKKSRELGFKIYCMSELLCDHIDPNTGICYPGEEEVQRIRKLVLEKHGKVEEMKEQDNLFSLDNSKKTIVFYAPYATEFSGDELERRGVGGTETAVINLAKILAKQFNVIVFSSNPRPGIYDGVKYLHIRDTEFMTKFTTDLLVVLRNAKILKDVDFRVDFKIKHIALWMHDIVASPAFAGIEEARYDTLICVSEWHKNEVISRFNIDKNKIVVLRNGVDNLLFSEPVEKVYGKLIYSSTPFRGLDKLLEVFPKIKEQVPEATLTVCSNMEIYGKGYTDEWKHLYKKASDMEAVNYLGSIPQKELAKEMKSSMIMAYYNTYCETGFINGIMSVTAGTPVVTSDMAAIPETVPDDTSIFIDANPESELYKKQFVNEIVKLLKDKGAWEKLSKNCLKYNFDWRLRADEWIKLFKLGGKDE